VWDPVPGASDQAGVTEFFQVLVDEELDDYAGAGVIAGGSGSGMSIAGIAPVIFLLSDDALLVSLW
jgi:hypothetical protein